MRTDQIAVQNAQRRAFHALADEFIIVPKHAKDHLNNDAELRTVMGHKDPQYTIHNPFHVDPKLITSPTEIVSEQAWVGSTNMIFDFSLNATNHMANMDNNVQITAGSYFAFYAIKLYYGTSYNNDTIVNQSGQTVPNSATTYYYSDTPTGAAGDQALYNGIIQFKVESNTLIDKMVSQQFRENNGIASPSIQYNEQGMLLINPVRIVKGIAGIQQIIWQANQQAVFTSGASKGQPLPVTPAAIVSCKLVGVWGQKNG